MNVLQIPAYCCYCSCACRHDHGHMCWMFLVKFAIVTTRYANLHSGSARHASPMGNTTPVTTREVKRGHTIRVRSGVLFLGNLCSVETDHLKDLHCSRFRIWCRAVTSPKSLSCNPRAS
jgi:hypothetical protein